MSQDYIRLDKNNAAVLLVDHQTGLLSLVRDIDPDKFKKKVQESLKRQVAAINKLTAKGMYFFDYGNAFLLESSRAGADIMKKDGTFKALFHKYFPGRDLPGPAITSF